MGYGFDHRHFSGGAQQMSALWQLFSSTWYDPVNPAQVSPLPASYQRF
jgi:hypothetical protein